MRKFSIDGRGNVPVLSIAFGRATRMRRLGVGRSRVIGKFVGLQWDVNILEDLTRRDAQNPIGGFDEIVSFATGVLPAEDVGKGEAVGKLFGFDQKTGAVGDPWRCGFHEC